MSFSVHVFASVCLESDCHRWFIVLDSCSKAKTSSCNECWGKCVCIGENGRIVRSAEIRHFFRFDLASSRIITQTAATLAPQHNIDELRKYPANLNVLNASETRQPLSPLTQTLTTIQQKNRPVRVHFMFHSIRSLLHTFPFHIPRPQVRSDKSLWWYDGLDKYSRDGGGALKTLLEAGRIPYVEYSLSSCLHSTYNNF